MSSIMSSPPSKTTLGIVTSTDDEFIYVWRHSLGTTNELKFPRNPAENVEPSDLVTYVQRKPVDEVQNVEDVQKEEDQGEDFFSIEKTSSGCKWKARVVLTFAPPETAQFQGVKTRDEDDWVHAVAYAEDFLNLTDELLMTPCYVRGVSYEPGKVYNAYVSRIPNKDHDAKVKAIGSIFLVMGKQFEEVTNQQTVKRILDKCPWNRNRPAEVVDERRVESPEWAETSEPVRPTTNFGGFFSTPLPETEKIQISAHQQPQRNATSNYEDEPLAESFIARQHHSNNAEEEEESVGLVVHCEPEYSVLWTPVHDLVRVQLMSVGEECGTYSNTEWPLAQWAHYQCFQDKSQLRGGAICQYTAVTVRKLPSGSREAIELGRGRVAIRLDLGRPREHEQFKQYLRVEDSFCGVVLCSAKDSELVQLLVNSEQPVEAYAVYTEQYKHSKWVVFSYLNPETGTWHRVKGLPNTFNDLCPPLQGNFGQSTGSSSAHEQQARHAEDFGTDDYDYEEEEEAEGFGSSTATATTLVNRFRPPSDWHGAHEEADGMRILDVLGVVVSFDSSQNSLVACRYGLARHRQKMALGTWLRANLKLLEGPGRKTLLDAPLNFVVTRSTKIAPPISTRAVPGREGSAEKLLLCCNIRWMDGRLENDYLGRVHASMEIPPQSEKSPREGYLAEIGLLFGGPEHNHLYWSVLKCHGVYSKQVNSVPLALSTYPMQLGRTCDDTQTVLNDRDYVDERLEHADENEKLSMAEKEVQKHAATIFDDLDPGAPNANSSSHRVNGRANSMHTWEHGNLSDELQTLMNLTSEVEVLLEPEQLEQYQPADGESSRFLGLVVQKESAYAIVYNRHCGDAILLRRYCPSQEFFDTRFALGQFVGVNFTRVEGWPDNDLAYGWICMPKFRPSNPLLETRILYGRHVQVKVQLQIPLVDHHPFGVYRPHFVVAEAEHLGRVLLEYELLTRNDLFGKSIHCWATHISPPHSNCHWRVVGSRLELLDDVVMVDLQQQQQQQQMGPQVHAEQAVDEQEQIASPDIVAADDFQPVEQPHDAMHDNGDAEEEEDEEEDYSDCNSFGECFHEDEDVGPRENVQAEIPGRGFPYEWTCEPQQEPGPFGFDKFGFDGDSHSNGDDENSLNFLSSSEHINNNNGKQCNTQEGGGDLAESFFSSMSTAPECTARPRLLNCSPPPPSVAAPQKKPANNTFYFINGSDSSPSPPVHLQQQQPGCSRDVSQPSSNDSWALLGLGGLLDFGGQQQMFGGGVQQAVPGVVPVKVTVSKPREAAAEPSLLLDFDAPGTSANASRPAHQNAIDNDWWLTSMAKEESEELARNRAKAAEEKRKKAREAEAERKRAEAEERRKKQNLEEFLNAAIEKNKRELLMAKREEEEKQGKKQ